MKKVVRDIFDELFERLPQLEPCRSSIGDAFNLLRGCYAKGGKVLVCGNGGSAADSEHIVGELMKGFLLKREISSEAVEKIKSRFPNDYEYLAGRLQGALPAISLVNQSALSSAFINDVAADMVFAQQVYGYAADGDVLIGISTSGNARNIINAVKIAASFGVKTIGMTGKEGGALKELCDVTIHAPDISTYRIQEYHLPVYHALCAMLEAEFFK
jgi:D-sedoheptulose 7-phosphate isomerase